MRVRLVFETVVESGDREDAVQKACDVFISKLKQTRNVKETFTEVETRRKYEKKQKEEPIVNESLF